ncbi:ATP-grasp domain-containing protein [Halogeometricum luteum]|uniref:ATP-grasp domain-containing protein n=1 Tax=Halogeometricum luteum TaxID=2950537 RepID=A0ABU2G363_9EURY|nr:ATP-grasp domain-containing protein [Halogeometricum sp. S3BR5-2]MDS0295231.1 ATP-grasp domain-containing protein [Halogeometricum sp. S3BR5-2]
MTTTTDDARTTMDDIVVLITGAGAPGASGIIKSLRSVDERDVTIVGVDMNSHAYGFALVDEAYVVPAGGDDDYVPRLLDVATDENVDIVLPLTTAELEPLAAAKERFRAEGIEVAVSDPDALAAANDKGDLYEAVGDFGLSAAPTYRRVASEAEFLDAVRELGYPENPVCFKRPVASGMRGFRVLDPDRDRLDSLLNEKPTAATTTLDEIVPVLSSGEEFPELVVMEFLPGAEYSVDVLAMGDEVGPVVPRSRERTRAGISFEGVVERNEDLIDAATEICRRLGLEYSVNLQFKYDADGTPKLLEINPRVSGTIIMCVGAGANFPYFAVKHALGEDIPPVDVDWGTRMIRYWQEVFHSPDGTLFHVTGENDRAPVVRGRGQR